MRGRGGQGTPCLDDDSAIPKSINGINTSNIFCNFDEWEWATLGPEWKRQILARREVAQQCDRNRNASEAGTWQCDQNSNPRLEKPDDTASNKTPAASQAKGGMAGRGFG